MRLSHATPAFKAGIRPRRKNSPYLVAAPRFERELSDFQSDALSSSATQPKLNCQRSGGECENRTRQSLLCRQTPNRLAYSPDLLKFALPELLSVSAWQLGHIISRFVSSLFVRSPSV